MKIDRYLFCVFACILAAGRAAAQCPARPDAGNVIANPAEVTSQNGVLNADLTFRSSIDRFGFLHECYIYQGAAGPVEAPTLRVNPGDQVILNLTNRLSYVPPATPGQHAKMHAGMASMDTRTTANDPCTGGNMLPTSTNIHFHGLNIPPKCHQDEIISTDIENTDAPFQYNFKIPANDQPGMYWYHPHLHGVVTLQINGGSPGALIVGGIEKLKPQVAGLPERVLIVRQQFTDPNSWVAGPSQLTLNYQPAAFPELPVNVIQMQPGTKEFWRVANASSETFLSLQVWIGAKPEQLEIVELDGIPVKQTTQVTTIQIPPAGRAEFIVTAPAAGQVASFQQLGFNTGPIGDPNPATELATIQATANAKVPPALPAYKGAAVTTPLRFAGLDTATVTAKRKIYFAEATNGSNGPTEFFITLDGQKPKVFSMTDPPAITTTVGAVEDWVVENRTGEVHAFHIHQIHFLFLGQNGQQFTNPELRDTVILPAWSGNGAFPNVTLRMDFREPQIAGRFVYHCHILDHEDGGMMAIIQVNPK